MKKIESAPIPCFSRKQVENEIKCKACPAFCFFATRLINLIIYSGQGVFKVKNVVYNLFHASFSEGNNSKVN